MPVESPRWKAATTASASVEWGTPPELYAALDAVHGFTVDAAASHDNHKHARYWTADDDGLNQSWQGERVFLNPPFGREIAKWTAKARREVRENGCELVVMLIPARTDTTWWHRDVEGIAEVKFLKGRVRYVLGDKKQPAPFASCLLYYRRTP